MNSKKSGFSSFSLIEIDSAQQNPIFTLVSYLVIFFSQRKDKTLIDLASSCRQIEYLPNAAFSVNSKNLANNNRNCYGQWFESFFKDAQAN